MSNADQVLELEERIVTAESRLYRAEKEANAWKNSNHSNAKMSQLFAESCRKEVGQLYTKLDDLKEQQNS